MAPSFYCISRTGRAGEVKGVYRRCPGCEIAQITVNRALFLTLWATVVARRLDFGEEEALSLAKAFTGLPIHSGA
jgi:hypothetical protein